MGVRLQSRGDRSSSRLERGMEMLKKPGMSVGNVAESLGFATPLDPSPFRVQQLNGFRQRGDETMWYCIGTNPERVATMPPWAGSIRRESI